MSAILERMPNYPYTPSEIFGPPPAFDYSAANVAYADASILVGELTNKSIPAVKSAVALMLYNRYLTWEKAKSLPYFMKTVSSLIQNEDTARKPGNPLPTIGFEIEFPTQILKVQAEQKYLHFNELSQAFGFPMNQNNLDDIQSPTPTLPTYWEEAPHYSYFHETQGRIISELLRARFTPPFQKSVLQKIEKHPDPKEAFANLVHKHIAHQGLSLHVNIGIPDAVENTLGFEADFRMLGATIALAFASQKRLDVEAFGKHLVKINAADESLKTTGADKSRLEFRGLEVIDEDVYTTLEVLQLLSTALFEANSPEELRYHTLSSIWGNHVDALFEVFPEYLHEYERILLGDSLAERAGVATLGEKDPGLASSLKTLLCNTAAEVRTDLQKRKLYPVSS